LQGGGEEKWGRSPIFPNLKLDGQLKPMLRISYGPDPLQFGELTLPEGGGPHPIVIVIHGGFWRAKYDLEYIRPVCEALRKSGIATWNLEYRRLGNPGGGWTGTLDDVAAGADHLISIAPQFPLDSKRLVVIGHSAGGHLALWLAGRNRSITGAITLAGVLDLQRAWELRLSNTVVAEFLGGSPSDFPDRYKFASPIERLPLGISQRLFHGTADDNVPIEISERYARAAQSHGDDVTLVKLEGAGHFEVVDPRTKEFAQVLNAVRQLV
jgi:acetyl esterase/lipase